MLCAIADILLLAASFEVENYPNLLPYSEHIPVSFLKMAGMSAWRLAWGGISGILVLPFYLAGFWVVWQGLNAAKSRYVLSTILLLAYPVTLGPCIHGTFMYLGEAVQVLNQVDSSAQLFVIRMLDRMIFSLKIVYGTAFICTAVGSLGFALLVGSGNTALPRWTAWGNPGVIFVVLLGLNMLLPEAVRIYVYPTTINLMYLTFFGIVTSVLWNQESYIINKRALCET